MGLSVNNDLVNLSDNFESLKAKVEAIEIIVYGEKVLELDDSTWENIRKKRDYILKSTDWTVIPGCSVDQAQWSAYRQNLRDIPQTYTVITDVTWPTQPSTLGPNSYKVPIFTELKIIKEIKKTSSLICYAIYWKYYSCC